MPDSAGTVADMLNPTVSIRYRPTLPDEFASPCGWRDDFEFRSRRADSHALAARTTVRQRTCFSLPSVLSMYETATTLPVASVASSRAIALATTCTLPVFIAGKICT